MEKMTERDKKLLIFLACFLLLFGFGYFNIHLRDKNNEIMAEIETKEIEMQTMEQKIARLDMTRLQAEELEISVEERGTVYYPMMKSQEIDKEITQMMFLEGVRIKSLNIVMPVEPLWLVPYAGANITRGISIEGYGESTVQMSTIYGAQIVITFSGDLNQFWNVIENLTTYERAIRITNMKMAEEKTVDGVTAPIQEFTISIELYMCQ